MTLPLPPFSANLGFLWRDLPLADAVAAAAEAGFAAVEAHWPYAEDPRALRAALQAAEMPLICINTRRGDVAAGDMGLSALPDRKSEAMEAVEEAIAFAATAGARHVHVMAGRAEGRRAHQAFLGLLEQAANLGQRHGIGVLIEPLNAIDVPGYFLNTTDQAAALLAELGRDEVRLMFDCYHAQISEGDLTRRLECRLPLIGHVQIAAVPSRAEPDEGEVAYGRLLRHLWRLGYQGYVGAEYRPRTHTAAGLGWLTEL
ncbi:MAG: TIM barrel protein [Pseudomonadota bacterium]